MVGCCCVVTSSLLVANEGFPSPHAGGYFTARGWSRFDKILGKKFYLKKNRYCCSFCFHYTVIYLYTRNLLYRSSCSQVDLSLCMVGARLWQLLAGSWVSPGLSMAIPPWLVPYGSFNSWPP